jgi:hypothetical protein
LYEIFVCYVALSLVIGVVSGMFIYFRIRFADPEEFQKNLEHANNDFLEELSQKGHLQKEVYGERTVYYEKDVLGSAANLNREAIRESTQKNPRRIALFMSMVAVVCMAVAWPKLLYDHLFTSSTEDVDSNR